MTDDTRSTNVCSAPMVFMSYSHDTPQHKEWVLELAKTLVTNGVDVILDQWDLRPGDDFAKFMERGVRDADRVLMICSENYVAKANDGVGGVGYEAMIVTGELVQNLGSAKFIPLIRQNAEKPQVPTSVSTRVYINLSEGADITSEMDKLLRELHHVPPTKPSLGKSPYNAPPTPTPPTPSTKASGGEKPPTDALNTYSRALEAARAADVLKWRRVVQDARAAMRPILNAWWTKYSRTAAPTIPELIEESMEGASAFSLLIAAALAGIASGNPKFQNQIGLLEDVLNPSEWQRGGLTMRVELPETGAFVYQALHGAMCLHVGNFPAAMRFAGTQALNRTTGTTLPLYQHHNIMAWPQSLGQNVGAAWKTALDLVSRWPWLLELFGDASDFQAALYAYYVALNALEYAENLRAGHPPPAANTQEFFFYRPHIPPAFEITPDEVKRRGYRLAITEGPAFKALWASMKLDEKTVLGGWSQWIALQKYFMHQVHPLMTLSFGQLIYDILRAE